MEFESTSIDFTIGLHSALKIFQDSLIYSCEYLYL